MTLKILHVVPSFIPAYRYGGVVFAVNELAKTLATNGVDVTVCTTSINGPHDSDVRHNEIIRMNGYQVIYFRSDKNRRWYYSTDMKHYLRKHAAEFDIVHLHSIFLFPTYYAAKICRQNNIPYVLTPHGMLDQPLIDSHRRFLKSLYIRIMERKVIKGANCLHFTSDQEFINAQKTKVFSSNHLKSKSNSWIIPNGIELPDLNEMKLDKEGRKDLLYLGRISWKKRIEDIILSLKYLPNHIRLNIVGRDDENYLPVLKKCIKDNNLEERVIFHGACYGEEKADMFLHSKLCIVCSVSENFALVVLEALSYGCPVIVTESVGASEIVKRNPVGLIAENEPKSIADNAMTLLKNDAQYHQMTQAAALVASEYSWQKLAEKYLTMYRAFEKHKSDRKNSVMNDKQLSRIQKDWL